MLFRINSSIKLPGVHFAIEAGNNTLIKRDSIEIIINENQHSKTTEHLGALSCQATLETEVNEEIEDILIAISSGSVGERLCGKLFDTPCKTYVTPKGREILIGHSGCFRNCLAVDLKPRIDQIESKIKSSVKEFVDVLSWRHGQDGSVSHKELEWSKDAKTWHPVPQTYNIADIELKGIQIFDICQIEEAVRLLDFSNGAPFYHEMFRKAWSFRKSHLEVALTIGISAVEAAMQECIYEFAPHADWWLGTRKTTPKLYEMLDEILPNINFKNRVLNKKGKVLVPAKLRNILQEARKRRNELVHSKKDSSHNLKAEEVQEMLLSIKDFIWLIDYYRGYDWACNYISQDIQKEILEARMKQT